MLSIENLNVNFISGNNGTTRDIVAVEAVTMGIESGETVAVIGESGSGKSVMGMAVCRLLPDSARVRGRITFKDRSILDLPANDMRRLRGRQIAFVPQSAGLSLNPTMVCGDQVAEVFTRSAEIARRSALKLTRILMGQLGLASTVVDAYPHLLSGGMRQRVLVGMGLAGAPDLLVADEPTKGIDLSRQKDVEDLFGRVRSKNPAMAILLITHDLRLARSLADKVAVMYAGRIVEQTPKEDFFAGPRHPYSRALLGALPENGLTPIAGQSPDIAARPGGCIFHPRCAVAMDRCKSVNPPQNGNGEGFVRCWTHADV